MSKTTMQMIADKCGVSKGLVSIALSNKYGVSDKTRSDIVICAIQMGYDFTKLRKFTSFQKKKLIYILTKDIDLQTDRFWPQIIKGIEAQANIDDYVIKVIQWNDTTDAKQFVSEVIDTKCAGIIIISELPTIIFSNLVLSGIPMVLVDGKLMYDDLLDTISVNNYTSFYNLTKLVIENGHKRIAFVGDIHHAYSFNQRFHGFRDCLMQYPDVTGIDLISTGDDIELTRIYNKQALEEAIIHNRADAYLCANDNIANRLYSLAKKHGINIPKDISVTGFDDNQESKSFIPPLTTIAVPKRELGQISLQLLRDRMKYPNAIFKRINLNCKIIERKSLANRYSLQITKEVNPT